MSQEQIASAIGSSIVEPITSADRDQHNLQQKYHGHQYPMQIKRTQKINIPGYGPLNNGYASNGPVTQQSRLESQDTHGVYDDEHKAYESSLQVPRLKV